MRLCVGTLRTIENEFDACRAAVAGQTLPPVEHFVVQDLPNLEAHRTLYRGFMQRASSCDLFLKIDADMVVTDPRFFENVADRFAAQPNVRAMLIVVHDYFSDRLIDAMHIYRSDTVWPLDDAQNVFVDPCPVPAEYVIHDTGDLAPAALHSPDPSPFQAFHFGVHKGVKVCAARQQNLRCAGLVHCENLEYTWRHFLRNGDHRLGLACLGGELALRGWFEPEHVDYQHPHTHAVFARYADHTAASLRRLVRRLRATHWGVGSAAMRWDILREGPARYFARRAIPEAVHPVLSRALHTIGIRCTPHPGMVHVQTELRREAA